MQFTPWSDGLVALFCSRRIGITPTAILAAGGRLARYRRQFTVIALPVVGSDLDHTKPIGNVIFNVTGGTLPAWTKDGRCRQVKVKALRGTKPGLIGVFDGGQPEGTDYKVEGPTDLLALVSAGLRPGERVYCNIFGCEEDPTKTPWLGDHVAGRHVVTIGDADEPGQAGANEWAACLARTAESSRLVTLPYEVTESRGKDLRDYFNEGHTRADFDGLVEGSQVVEPSQEDGDEDKPNEAVDDPHRLARLYVERSGSNGDHQTLWIWRDDWYLWNGAAYRVTPPSEIRAGITRVVKAEFDADNIRAIARYVEQKEAGNISEESDKGPPQCRKVTTGVATNVAHALTSECLLPGHIDQPTWLDGSAPFPADEILATASGLLHLPSLAAGEPCLLPPTPVFFSSNALPYGFDPMAECHEWIRFLDTLWPDDGASIATLQEWFGYCLTQDTRQHKLLMMVGPPRCGKGTIARVLNALIGDQNLCSPTLASISGPFGLQPLVAKLVALIADARLSGRADAVAVVERLLSISGEDPQDVARKNLPTLAGIKLPVKFVVMTNELPNMRDSSGALTTRVILLRLTRSFRGREDRTLTSKLKKELPGILNWSIRGWQRLQERGCFIQPESGQELLDDLEDLASPVSAFVRENCYVGPEWECEIQNLYSAWLEWCQSHGRDHAGTVESFGRDLRAAFPSICTYRPKKEERRVRCYKGIQLR